MMGVTLRSSVVQAGAGFMYCADEDVVGDVEFVQWYNHFIIYVQYWGNLKTDIRRPERNVANQGAE
jgi:hypothetical protein